MDAGYSGTPQLKKLGLTPHATWAIVGRPRGWSFEIEPDAANQVSLATPSSAGTAGGQAVDVIVAFAKLRVDVPTLLERLEPFIFPAGALWVAWPRKAAGHDTDITGDVVREAALARSLVDTKVAAIDADWSGLKLVWRVAARG